MRCSARPFVRLAGCNGHDCYRRNIGAIYWLMRCHSTLLLVALAAATQGFAQQNPTAASTPIKLEDQWTSALVRRDTKTFDRLLAPNFVYTEDAAVMTRADVMKSVTGPDHVE